MPDGTKTSCTLKQTCNFHLQVFKYVCPFVTTRHEKVKNCSNMSFSALQIFLVFLLSENINEPVWNVWNPVMPLSWFGSYGQLQNNSHTDWWLSVCVILFLCAITETFFGETVSNLIFFAYPMLNYFTFILHFSYCRHFQIWVFCLQFGL